MVAAGQISMRASSISCQPSSSAGPALWSRRSMETQMDSSTLAGSIVCACTCIRTIGSVKAPLYGVGGSMSALPGVLPGLHAYEILGQRQVDVRPCLRCCFVESLESCEFLALLGPPEAKRPITPDYRRAAVTVLGRCRCKGSFHDVGHPLLPRSGVSHSQEVAFLSGQSARQLASWARSISDSILSFGDILQVALDMIWNERSHIWASQSTPLSNRFGDACPQGCREVLKLVLFLDVLDRAC